MSAPPVDSAIPRSILLFDQIQKDVTHCRHKLAGVQSPSEKLANDVKEVQTKLDAAWKEIFENNDASRRSQLRADIQTHARELEKLKFTYDSNLKQLYADYSRRVDALVIDACEKLRKTIEAALDSSQQAEPSQISGSQDVPQADKHHSTSTKEKSPSKRSEKSARNLTRAENSNAESAGGEIVQSHKRHREPSPEPQPLRKHPRLTRKAHQVIWFNEVYQDSNAPVKHVIVQWPPNEDRWYIVRCDEHDMTFKDNPLIGSAAHVRSKKHNHKPSDHNTVIKLLGVEVIGCDNDLAEKNNAVARQAFLDSFDEHFPSQGKGRSRDHRRQHGSPETVIKPECGQVYRVYWNMSKQWLAALLLPFQDLQDVGIPYSIESLGLLYDLPKCCIYHSETNSISWGEGYEDGGPKAASREFPVMFFDGSPFPSHSSVAWVNAVNLQPYDASTDSLIEHNQQAREYLAERHGKTIQDTNPETEEVASDIDDPEIGEQPEIPHSPSSSSVEILEQAPSLYARSRAGSPRATSQPQDISPGNQMLLCRETDASGDILPQQEVPREPSHNENDLQQPHHDSTESRNEAIRGVSGSNVNHSVPEGPKDPPCREDPESQQDTTKMAQMAWDVINQSHPRTGDTPAVSSQTLPSSMEVQQRATQVAISQSEFSINPRYLYTEPVQAQSTVIQPNATPFRSSLDSQRGIAHINASHQASRAIPPPNSTGLLPPMRTLEDTDKHAEEHHPWSNYPPSTSNMYISNDPFYLTQPRGLQQRSVGQSPNLPQTPTAYSHTYQWSPPSG